MTAALRDGIELLGADTQGRPADSVQYFEFVSATPMVRVRWQEHEAKLARDSAAPDRPT